MLAMQALTSTVKLKVSAELAGWSAWESTSIAVPGGDAYSLSPLLAPSTTEMVDDGLEYDDTGHSAGTDEPTVVWPGAGALT